MSKKPQNHSEAWGLELGGSAVRLVHVVRTGTSYRADRYWEVSLEERWTSAPALAAAVDKLRGRASITGPLGVALPDEWVLHRVLVLPSAERAALAAMVANQTELLLPAQASAFTWSWGHAADPFQTGKVRVLLCAARKEALTVLPQCAAALGQAPVVAMPSAMALATAWPLLHEPNGSLLLVDVAARNTSLVLLHQGRPICCTVVDEGGDRWTQRLAASEGLTPQQAESIKLDYSGQGRLSKDLSAHVGERLSQETARWADQLREAYADCVADIPRQHRPTRCVLLGRAALTPDLVNLVSATLDVSASLAHLPPLLSVDSDVAFDQAAGAISAAVAAMQEQAPLVNLAGALPDTRPAWRRGSWRWAAVAAWVLLATTALYALDLHHAGSLRQAVANVQAKIGGQAELALAKAVGQHLENGAPPPLDVLEEVSALAPKQVQLTSWRYSRKGAISLIGTVANQSDHQEFLKKLADSPLVARVEPGPTKMENNRLTFEVTLTAMSGRSATTTRPTSAPSSQPTTTSAPADGRRGRGDRSSGDSSDRSDRRSRRSRRDRSQTDQPATPTEQPSGENPGGQGPPPPFADEGQPMPPPDSAGQDNRGSSQESSSQPSENRES